MAHVFYIHVSVLEWQEGGGDSTFGQQMWLHTLAVVLQGADICSDVEITKFEKVKEQQRAKESPRSRWSVEAFWKVSGTLWNARSSIYIRFIQDIRKWRFLHLYILFIYLLIMCVKAVLWLTGRFPPQRLVEAAEEAHHQHEDNPDLQVRRGGVQ